MNRNGIKGGVFFKVVASRVLSISFIVFWRDGQIANFAGFFLIAISFLKRNSLSILEPLSLMEMLLFQ